jgi:hypothetical protein
MSTLTSIKDGSLGAVSNQQVFQDGSLGNHLFQGMDSVSGVGLYNMTAVSGHESSFQDGSLGCGCGTSGLGEYFEGGLSGIKEMFASTPAKVGAGVAAVAALYFLSKKSKLVKNMRRQISRKSRRRR